MFVFVCIFIAVKVSY